MATSLALWHGQRWKEASQRFILTFPDAWIIGGFDPTLVDQSLDVYVDLVKNTYFNARTRAAQDLNTYLNRYGVRVNNSADEYKLLYFWGVAIHSQLKAVGLADIARAHLIAMLIMLHFKLDTLGINKPTLFTNLSKIIKQDLFEQELGSVGGYLIYKTISTTMKSETF